MRERKLNAKKKEGFFIIFRQCVYEQAFKATYLRVTSKNIWINLQRD